ncbi:di-trans,poly-cis-decaprenylcistransferase [Patescibacteria group bacterium]|nr:di-trans,poly-cis-decaprenylcistransferase [Patescibacteria group bacterium]
MKIPKHLAIIMDGNRRWARREGKKNVVEGHRSGADTLEYIVEKAVELGIEYLTVYTFSTENFSRSPEELRGLFEMCVEFAGKKWKKLRENNVRVKMYGNLSLFPKRVSEAMEQFAGKSLREGHKMTLGLCFGYGGRQEIVAACKEILKQNVDPEEVTEDLFEKNLYTAGVPDVDLIIRTGGARRISNFLLWKLAYAEIVFVDKFWPEFSEADLLGAIEEYSSRERRFGK